MNDIVCPLCNKKNLVSISFNKFNTYTHLDFKNFNIQGNRIISQCRNCMLIFNNNYLQNIIKIKKKFKSKSYIEHTEYHSVSNKNSNSLLIDQAHAILKHLPLKKNNSILDFGCFDGSLLNTLYSNNKNNLFFGYDIIKPKNIIKNNNIKYIYKFQNLKKYKFDSIILSHSFMYIENISYILEELYKLLNPKGLIYIQFPKIDIRPLYLLMDDQLYFPTAYPIINLLKENNFSNIKMYNKFSPKDEVVIGYKTIKKSKNQSLIKQKNSKNLKYFYNKIEKYIIEIKKINQNKKKIYIFGTTIEASFLNNYLKKCIGFVDENIEKNSIKFFNKNVFHPSDLSYRDQIVFIGERYHKIAKKLQKTYKLNCFLIR